MERKEVKKEYRWATEDLFASESDWDRAFEELKQYPARLSTYKGTLSDKQAVLSCLKETDACNVLAEKLAVYASMKRDEDTRDTAANKRYNRILSFLPEISEQTAFVEPELSALPEETLSTRIQDPDFSDYDYLLNRLLAQKPYILSEKEERILALTHDFADDFENVFTMIDNADLDFPTVEVDGKPVLVTHGTYAKLLQDKRQSVRKVAFDAYYRAYEKLKNTLAANYYANVKKNIFYAKARGYQSYLQKCMLSEDVPSIVYETLLTEVAKGLPVLHEYVAYRKQALGLDQLYMYDLYTPIVADAELSVEYDRACELVLEALAPLGTAYTDQIKKGMTSGWIDVYETTGKRSGGYCTHAYAAPHPYVLLNYTGTTHDVFTLAHELGHAMHSFYSSRTQPIAKADYRIFVAEVASTVNEMLLLEHLLKTTQDPRVKKFLLAYRLDTIRTTIFRQTMFSAFEADAHQRVESGEPLTEEGLSAKYAELNRAYYGDAVEADEHIRYEWMRIPHFYYSFYVYKYATGLTAAIDIAQRILDGTMGDAYQTFLSAGGSKSPYEILRDCGVDLATPQPYQRVRDVFKRTLEELKSI